MATFGLNNNLNNSYQGHSNANSAQNQGIKAENTITQSMGNIKSAIDSIGALKSDSGMQRAQGIAQIIMALLG